MDRGTADARFEVAPFSDQPLRLKAEDAEDLTVLSSLVQDAVMKIEGIRWMARRHRLVLLMNRFRWEDREAAQAERRPFERVQSGLTIDGVLGVRSRGIENGRPEAVLQVLALGWVAGEDGAGALTVTFAGGAALEARAEMLDVSLADLTRPWQATATSAPNHGD